MVNRKAVGNVGIVIAIILLLAGVYLLMDRSTEEPIEAIIPFQNIKEEVPSVFFENREAFLINSAAEYEEVFDEETNIDFNEYSIVAVFSGQKPTGGYNVEITGITETTNRIKIDVLETTPGEDCIVIQVITFPYDVVLIESIEKTPEFVFEETILEC